MVKFLEKQFKQFVKIALITCICVFIIKTAQAVIERDSQYFQKILVVIVLIFSSYMVLYKTHISTNDFNRT